jgi:hypothetical protein
LAVGRFYTTCKAMCLTGSSPASAGALNPAGRHCQSGMTRKHVTRATFASPSPDVLCLRIPAAPVPFPWQRRCAPPNGTESNLDARCNGRIVRSRVRFPVEQSDRSRNFARAAQRAPVHRACQQSSQRPSALQTHIVKHTVNLIHTVNLLSVIQSSSARPDRILPESVMTATAGAAVTAVTAGTSRTRLANLCPPNLFPATFISKRFSFFPEFTFNASGGGGQDSAQD